MITKTIINENGYRVYKDSRKSVHKSNFCKELKVDYKKIDSKHWSIHHINFRKQCNDVDNLALMTKKGHNEFHEF